MHVVAQRWQNVGIARDGIVLQIRLKLCQRALMSNTVLRGRTIVVGHVRKVHLRVVPYCVLRRGVIGEWARGATDSLDVALPGEASALQLRHKVLSRALLINAPWIVIIGDTQVASGLQVDIGGQGRMSIVGVPMVRTIGCLREQCPIDVGSARTPLNV